MSVCKINDADCSKGDKLTRGWCATHYTRWKRHGDPLTVLPHAANGSGPRGEAHPRWAGNDITYDGMHQRLDRERGKASVHNCVMCAGPAFQWSYDGLDLDELVESGDRRYSLNPDHYRPMCARCHNQRDHSGKKYPRKFNGEKAEEIRALAVFGIPQVRLAKMYDTSQMNIGRIVRVERWKPESVCTTLIRSEVT